MFLHTIRHRLTRLPGHANSDPSSSKLSSRMCDVLTRSYDLGFTAFGGPPVHFQILHRRFVDGQGKTPWIDEQTYQEIFALSQVLPGPASTKMLYTIATTHAGYIPGALVFLLWSLPGAIGMYGLSLGVHQMDEVLPAPVYGLLSGLNAATVGIIALAAVQLARRAITDRLTRALVAFGGCAGLLYNALWYFPVLLAGASIITIFWDIYIPQFIRYRKKRRTRKANLGSEEPRMADDIQITEIPLADMPVNQTMQRLSRIQSKRSPSPPPMPENETPYVQPTSQMDVSAYGISVKQGVVVIILFFVIFAVLIALRSSLDNPPLPLALFNNMFLAGTIIFGGGPVVIPLLREYVVEPGWVSSRDFTLGLAIAQAFPGPNFNFAVYLGSLAITSTGFSPSKSLLGAVLGFVGIFTPGIWLSIGFQSVWRTLRKKKAVTSLLRGVNAAAVGFVFTAVYRIWQVGYLTPSQNTGVSLGKEPWWLVVSATTFTLVEWYNIPPAIAIILGGLAGLGWWGAVRNN